MNQLEIVKQIKELPMASDIINELLNERLPLVMFGAGDLACNVYRYLKENNVRIDSVSVDDNYIDSEDNVFSDMDIIPWSELEQKYDSFNVIMGNCAYELKDVIQARQGVNKVFLLFSVNYGVFNTTPLDYIEKHEREYVDAYNSLADEESRKAFLALLKTRVTGNNDYVTEAFIRPGNFFNNDIFKVGQDEVLLNVGAYNGDTIKLFLRETDCKYKRIYAVEPDVESLKIVDDYIKDNNLDRFEISSIGAYNTETDLKLNIENHMHAGISDRGNTIHVKCLDEIFDYREPVTILEINYFEGVVEALEGAKDILTQNNPPKLAVTVGFDCRNVYMIPNLIKRINPSYNLYLRYNHAMTSLLTLYGVSR